MSRYYYRIFWHTIYGTHLQCCNTIVSSRYQVMSLFRAMKGIKRQSCRDNVIVTSIISITEDEARRLNREMKKEGRMVWI